MQTGSLQPQSLSTAAVPGAGNSQLCCAVFIRLRVSQVAKILPQCPTSHKLRTFICILPTKLPRFGWMTAYPKAVYATMGHSPMGGMPLFAAHYWYSTYSGHIPARSNLSVKNVYLLRVLSTQYCSSFL